MMSASDAFVADTDMILTFRSNSGICWTYKTGDAGLVYLITLNMQDEGDYGLDPTYHQMIYVDFPTNGKQTVKYNIETGYALHGWTSSAGSAFVMTSNPTTIYKGLFNMIQPRQSHSAMVDSSKGSFAGYAIVSSILELSFHNGATS